MGPLLNPAIAFGLIITSMEFNYVVQYLVMPLAGCLGGLLFHELILKKTMDIMEDSSF